MSQFVLFYSHRCSTSYDFIQLCQRSGNRDKFVFVNVDVNKNIPSYVTSIPCVWDRQNKNLVDMELLLNAFKAPIVATREPSAICNSLGSLTDNFSFISDDPEDTHVIRDFHYINTTDDSICTPGENDGNNFKEGKGQESSRKGGNLSDMDRLVQQREQDIIRIIETRPPPPI